MIGFGDCWIDRLKTHQKQIALLEQRKIAIRVSESAFRTISPSAQAFFMAPTPSWLSSSAVGEAWRLLESMCPDERKCLARLGRLADVSSCYPRLIVQRTKSLILLNGPPFSSPPCKSREKASQQFHCLLEFSSKKLRKLKTNHIVPVDSPLLLSRGRELQQLYFLFIERGLEVGHDAGILLLSDEVRKPERKRGDFRTTY